MKTTSCAAIHLWTKTFTLALKLVSLINQPHWTKRLPSCKHLSHFVVIHIEIGSLNCSLNLFGRRKSNQTTKIMFSLSSFNKSNIFPFTQISVIYDNTFRSFFKFLIKLLEYCIVDLLDGFLINLCIIFLLFHNYFVNAKNFSVFSSQLFSNC